MDSPHVRIAITTNSLIAADANFAAARQMVFYDVSGDASEFVDVVHFTGGRKGAGGGKGKSAGKGLAGGGCVMEDMDDDEGGTGLDPMTERVEALRGTSVLFTLGLSDVAAVRVHNLKIFPVKSAQVRAIDEVIANVQRLLSGNPPLWLRRVIRDGAGNPLALDDQEIVFSDGQTISG